ncbi:MAG: signal recognition particle-docking protein FtsY [Nanoarchaeota archaeon]|nr:signal recognition particle-docking protein FtsY [Nanoarchaeota archaeon]
MFKFLKEKLKAGISALTKKIDEEAPEEIVEVPVKKNSEETGKTSIPEVASVSKAAEPLVEKKVAPIPKEEKRGFFSKLFGKKEIPVEVAPPAPIEEPPLQEHVEDVAVPTPKEIPVETPVAEEYPEEKEEEHIPEAPLEAVTSFSEDKELNEQPVQKVVVSEKIDIAKLIEEAPEIEEEPEDPIQKRVHEEPKKEERVMRSREITAQKVEPAVEKKGFFAKLTEKIVTKKISSEKFDELFWDLEVGLLENNVAVEVIEKLKADLKTALVDIPIRRGQVEETIVEELRKSIAGVLDVPPIDLLQRISKKKPFVICFVGINGSGKTTSIAKVTRFLLDHKKKVVLAAADTFRAAAIDQLQIHADNLGVKMIKHDYGSDPAAVAFDAVKYAEAKDADVVLIDTAGRLHSNTNLVDEMKKIMRVAKPDLKLFVGEAITGNDCVEQAQQFNSAIGIDGIILAKADIDEKGGAALSVSYVTQKPILFLGMGQEYTDLKRFDKEEFLQSLGLT